MAIVNPHPSTLIDGSNADSLHRHGLRGLSGRAAASSWQANIYVPVRVETPATATWYTHLADPTNPARGYRVDLAKVGNIHCILGIYSGDLRPAYYAPFAPTTTDGTIASATDSGYQFYPYSTGKWCQWTMPASAAGIDKLVFNWFGQTGDPRPATVTVNGATVGTLDTSTAGAHNQTTTITLATPLAEGDLVRIAGDSGSPARVYGWWGYNSTGTWSSGKHRIILNPVELIPSTSAVETVNRLAPTGQAPKWIGSLHQGGTNGTQVDVTETVTVAGSEWTPATGYSIGIVTITRTSTLEYAAETDIGTMDEAYTITDDHIGYWCKVTLSEAWDSDARYPMMLPVSRDCSMVYGDGLIVDPTGDTADYTYSYGPQQGWTAVVGSIAVTMRLTGASEAVTQSIVNPRSTMVKSYVRFRNRTNAPAGSWEHGWLMTFADAVHA